MKRHFVLVEEQHCDSHYCEIVHLRSAHDAGEKDLLIDGVGLRESVCRLYAHRRSAKVDRGTQKNRLLRVNTNASGDDTT